MGKANAENNLKIWKWATGGQLSADSAIPDYGNSPDAAYSLLDVLIKKNFKVELQHEGVGDGWWCIVEGVIGDQYRKLCGCRLSLPAAIADVAKTIADIEASAE
jgi:hypothetical protein